MPNYESSPEYRANKVTAREGTFGSIDTDELSNYHIVDPDASDWGAAVNSILSSASQGDVILVPPIHYDTSTTATVDVDQITIASLRNTGRTGWRNANPKISKTGDIGGPIIEATTQCAIHGLSLNGFQASEAEDGIVTNSSTDISDIVGQYLGDNVVNLYTAVDGDNVNSSRVYNVSGYNCQGDVVATNTETGVTRNANAMEIFVRSSFQNYGYAVNLDVGIGNRIAVAHIEGGNHTGGVRLNDNSNQVAVSYMEGNINQGIVFDDSKNYAEVGHSGLSEANTFVLNHSNNQWFWTANNKRYAGFDTHRFGGKDIEQLRDGGGVVVTTPDGSGRYRIRVDNSGNVVTDAL